MLSPSHGCRDAAHCRWAYDSGGFPAYHPFAQVRNGHISARWAAPRSLSCNQTPSTAQPTSAWRKWVFFERSHAPGRHGSAEAVLAKPPTVSMLEHAAWWTMEKHGHHSADKAVSSSSQDWLWSAPDQQLTLPMARPRRE